VRQSIEGDINQGFFQGVGLFLVIPAGHLIESWYNEDIMTFCREACCSSSAWVISWLQIHHVNKTNVFTFRQQNYILLKILTFWNKAIF